MLLRNQIFEQLLSTPPGTEFDIRNTPFFNILCANPSLAIFYADFFRLHGANSSLVKDLEAQSEYFSIRINPLQNHGKAHTQWQATTTFVSALTSRSTEPAAARPLCA